MCTKRCLFERTWFSGVCLLILTMLKRDDKQSLLVILEMTQR